MTAEELARIEADFWRQRCLWAEEVADELASALTPLIRVGQDNPQAHAVARWSRWRRAREQASRRIPPADHETEPP